MQKLKIFGGYVQAQLETPIKQGVQVKTATAALVVVKASEAEALAKCKAVAHERYPKSRGWANHSWDVAELDGVTIEQGRR